MVLDFNFKSKLQNITSQKQEKQKTCTRLLGCFLTCPLCLYHILFHGHGLSWVLVVVDQVVFLA